MSTFVSGAVLMCRWKDGTWHKGTVLEQRPQDPTSTDPNADMEYYVHYNDCTCVCETVCETVSVCGVLCKAHPSLVSPRWAGVGDRVTVP